MSRLSAARWRCSGAVHAIFPFARWTDCETRIVELVVAPTHKGNGIATGTHPSRVVSLGTPNN